MVDSDDLSKSFIVRRFIGRKGNSEEDEDVVDEDAALAGQEGGIINNNGRPAAPQNGRSWGARGISVSADDTLSAPDRPGAQRQGSYADLDATQDAQMADPSHFLDEDEDVDAPPPPAKDSGYKPRSSPTSPLIADTDDVLGSSAEEWQENTGAK